MTQPILYSFRRCPYAIRARLAIYLSGIECELREVVLKNKPAEMLEASAKGTVPILILENRVLDESLDIMNWALQQPDFDSTVIQNSDHPYLDHPLIFENDNYFKYYLDRYKYADRYPELPQQHYLQKACVFIQKLEHNLHQNSVGELSLLTSGLSLVDMAILPFIRQFSFVDKTGFRCLNFPKVQRWLEQFLTSHLFSAVMTKYPEWRIEKQQTIFAAKAAKSMVEHDCGQQCFNIKIGESRSGSTEAQLAYMKYKMVGDNAVDFYATQVPHSQRGKGLAALLVEAGFAWAKENGLEIQASCWYAAKKLAQ